MKRLVLIAAAVAALCVTATAGAAPPVLATPGSSPFDGCTADQATAQQAAGSVLYPNSEVEPRADIDPTNPLNIVGEYQQDRWSDGGARGLVTSVSRDGGSSWHRVVVPGITRCSGGTYDRASDPWLSYAPNGDLYAISLSFDAFDTRNAIIVSKSTTKGESWRLAHRRHRRRDERPRQGVDHRRPVRRPNFVYAVWDRFLSPPGGLHASDQGIDPREVVRPAAVVLAHHERRRLVGAGARGVQPRNACRDDRQHDQRAAEPRSRGRHARLRRPQATAQRSAGRRRPVDRSRCLVVEEGDRRLAGRPGLQQHGPDRSRQRQPDPRW